MDLRSVASPFNLDNESWPIRTLAYDNPPGNFIYRLVGDTSPDDALHGAPGVGIGHTDTLPVGVLGGSSAAPSRTYRVWNVDVAPTFDSDGDGNPGNDIDYKKVTVTVQWQEQH